MPIFISANTILGRLGTDAPIATLLKLINTHGLQNLLYGTAAATLSHRELNNLDFSYNSVFSKKFKTSVQSTIIECQFYCGNLPFFLSYDLYRFVFLRKLLAQGILNLKSSLDAIDVNDLTLLQNKYNFSLGDSLYTLKTKIWRFFSNILGVSTSER